MTIELTTETSGDAAAIPGHYHFRGVLGTEWIKLRSRSRSTVWTLLTTAIVGVGLGAIVTSAQAARFDSPNPRRTTDLRPDPVEPRGIPLRATRHRRARRPHRLRGVLDGNDPGDVFRDPASAFRAHGEGDRCSARSCFVVGEAVAFVAFFVGQGILSGHTPTASLSDASALTGGDLSGSLPRRARAPRARACDDHPPYRGGHQRLRGHRSSSCRSSLPSCRRLSPTTSAGSCPSRSGR